MYATPIAARAGSRTDGLSRYSAAAAFEAAAIPARTPCPGCCCVAAAALLPAAAPAESAAAHSPSRSTIPVSGRRSCDRPADGLISCHGTAEEEDACHDPREEHATARRRIAKMRRSAGAEPWAELCAGSVHGRMCGERKAAGDGCTHGWIHGAGDHHRPKLPANVPGWHPQLEHRQPGRELRPVSRDKGDGVRGARRRRGGGVQRGPHLPGIATPGRRP